MNPNTPVLVGIGITDQRESDPSVAREAIALMIEATQQAAADAGAAELLRRAQRISVPKGIWSYSDPAALIAKAVGAENATTVLAEIGILQQSLFGDACNRIASGEIDVAIVAGGEAKYRSLQAGFAGVEASETAQDKAPDVLLEPESEIWSPIESAAGLGMPVGYYAIMESALCHAKGESVDQHRDRVAAMYSGFSEIARNNPHAWNRDGMSAEQIRDASAKNKMLAFPYTKYHNTQWNVDQASAMIFCSVAVAEELDIPREKWVFPLSSTESNYMVNTSQRAELHGSAGARLAGNRALELAGVSADELDLLEMYSCFPSAVQIYARELGIDLDSRPLTVTGGMTFAGGPLNNYVLQSTCRMAELLREQPSSKGLVTSVSGMLTKQGFGVWSTEPNPDGYQFADVTAQARAETEVIELVEATPGPATVAGYTVVYQGEAQQRAIAVLDLPGGRRTVAFSEDGALMQQLVEQEYCGKGVAIIDGGQFALSA